MAKRKLDVFDVANGPTGPRIGSVTLDGGQLTYEGDIARNVFRGWLRKQTPTEVFDHFVGYSNGAIAFREAKV